VSRLQMDMTAGPLFIAAMGQRAEVGKAGNVHDCRVGPNGKRRSA